MSHQSGKEGVIKVEVENRQGVRAVPEELIRLLEGIGRAAAEEIQARDLVLTELPFEVSVSLLDDVMIGEVHGQYMDDPAPTDVITFPYGPSGEILISVETAAAQAVEYGMTWERELALYLVHGLLHLCGYADGDDEGREQMSALQMMLLEEVSKIPGLAI